MKETTKRRVRGALIALVCFLLGGLVTLGVVWKVVGQDGRTLLQAYQLIRSEFVGEYDSQTHLETTLETMVDALGDRWSYYLTPEEAQQVKANRENTYVGIGITVGQNVEEGLEILRVTEGSPAQEAGLQAGEIIRGVDGQAITSDNRETMLSAIQGEEGTTVSLEVEGTDGARRTVEVTRQEIHGVTATWTMTENQVGLVTILNFYAGTADLVKQGVAALQEEGAQALVFDLRNNPGGYVTELTEILDYLLPEGNIFISRTNDGEEVTYTSDASCVDLPMAVLVNATATALRSSLPLSSGNLWALRWSGSRPAARGIPRSSSICPTAAPLACLRPGTIPARGCPSSAQGLRRTQRLPSVRRTSRDCWQGSLPRQRTRSFRPQWRRWASRKAAWPGGRQRLSHHFPLTDREKLPIILRRITGILYFYMCRAPGPVGNFVTNHI